MASYSITDIVRTQCPAPGASAHSHVSGVVLDRGGAYLVTDIYDFMDHGHTFPASRTRCRHCGRPTLALATVPGSAIEPTTEPITEPASEAPATSQPVPGPRRKRGSRVVQHVDVLSNM